MRELIATSPGGSGFQSTSTSAFLFGWTEKTKKVSFHIMQFRSMPFTPYHLGPALLFGLLFLSFIDLPTFLVASVIVNIEQLFVLTLNLNYPLHGFFHSFLGGTFIAVLLALIMHRIRDRLSPLLSFFKLEQKMSLKSVLVASFLGI
jgi:hypothetical protein